MFVPSCLSAAALIMSLAARVMQQLIAVRQHVRVCTCCGGRLNFIYTLHQLLHLFLLGRVALKPETLSIFYLTGMLSFTWWGGGQFASSVIPICDILEGIITSVAASATASVPSRYRLHFQDKTESFREAPTHFHFIQMALLRRRNISARA